MGGEKNLNAAVEEKTKVRMVEEGKKALTHRREKRDTGDES